MTLSPARIQGIGQISIAVSDVDRAVAFYRDTLQLPLLFTFPGMAFFDCGGVRLYLAVPEPGFARTSIIYFRVESIGEAHRALVDRGVKFVHEPRKVHADARHELWLAFFTDPDENHLALMSEVPVAMA